MTALITGGCGCGSVRFEVYCPFLSASYCHCTRCQHRSGSGAAATARAEPGLRPRRRGRRRAARVGPRRRAGEGLLRAVWVCALQLRPGLHRYTGVRLGAVDGEPGVRPASHQFVAYAACWEELPDDGLPRYPEARPGYSRRSLRHRLGGQRDAAVSDAHDEPVAGQRANRVRVELLFAGAPPRQRA